jgi:DNA-binding transcriptional LysR family regulator
MELRTIEYFLAIAQQGSLRAAARELGITQPALTKAMRRLEDEAGVALFDRKARGMTLTVYGQSLLRHARALRASLADATSEIRSLRAGTAGLVPVGAGPSWQRAILPEAIALFRSERPGVQLQVTGGTDDHLKAGLRAGTLDVVLAALPDVPLEPDLERKALIYDDYRVVAAAGHPLRRQNAIRLENLLAFPWILSGPETVLAERLRIIFRAHGLPAPEPVIETNITPLKLALMRNSAYLSFHAEMHLEETESGRIGPRDVPGATWRRAAGVMTRKGVEPNPAAAALAGTIERVCARVSAGAGSA